MAKRPEDKSDLKIAGKAALKGQGWGVASGLLGLVLVNPVVGLFCYAAASTIASIVEGVSDTPIEFEITEAQPSKKK